MFLADGGYVIRVDHESLLVRRSHHLLQSLGPVVLNALWVVMSGIAQSKQSIRLLIGSKWNFIWTFSSAGERPLDVRKVLGSTPRRSTSREISGTGVPGWL